MKIIKTQAFSLSDFPGCVAAIVFTGGCNFRCSYCHNNACVFPGNRDFLNTNDVLEFLGTRTGRLQGVVISGGEPTLQGDLIPFCREIKELGFLVKVDTNGSRPVVLEELMKKRLVDYIAMDIKAPFNKYSDIAGTVVDTAVIQRSIRLIMEGKGIDYEFRTTVVKSQLSPDDIYGIGRILHGAKRYILQKFIHDSTLDPKLKTGETYTDRQFQDIIANLRNHVDECSVR